MSSIALDERLYFSIEIKYFVAKKYFEFDEIKVLFIFLVVRSEFNQNMVLSNIYKMKTLPTKENFVSFLLILGSAIKTEMQIFMLNFRFSDFDKTKRRSRYKLLFCGLFNKSHC